MTEHGRDDTPRTPVPLDPATLDPGLLDRALRLATRASAAGGEVALAHFRDTSLRIETKADGSLVSIADRAAEDAVRRVLAEDRELGACDVLGEERGEVRGVPSGGSGGIPSGGPGGIPSGGSGGVTGLRWVIDPIDGTFLFVNGIPLWGTLVALEIASSGTERAYTGLVGVVRFPAIGAVYSAARGRGATRDGTPIAVTSRVDPERTVVHVPDERSFARRGLGGALATIRSEFPRTRGYFDCFGHAMAAEGAFGAAVDLGCAHWDVAASRVLVEEAGGEVRIRPGARPGTLDAILGAPAVVARLATILAF